MSPPLMKKQILFVVDCGIHIMNIVVIVTNRRQCLSHLHDINTAHNNTCSFYITSAGATKPRLTKAEEG